MLELLHGPDRTANSMELLARICENAAHGVAGQILIVPEQYSHETERALCERGGDTISRYAEVLSFTRLASRVFSVCGGVCEEYLDENGRILTLYLAAQQVREQLKFYAAVMTRPDFLKQLGALMEELLTSCVTPDALHAAAARLEGRLAQKITELALLYESYLSVCKTGRGRCACASCWTRRSFWTGGRFSSTASPILPPYRCRSSVQFLRTRKMCASHSSPPAGSTPPV